MVIDAQYDDSITARLVQAEAALAAIAEDVKQWHTCDHSEYAREAINAIDNFRPMRLPLKQTDAQSSGGGSESERSHQGRRGATGRPGPS